MYYVRKIYLFYVIFFQCQHSFLIADTGALDAIDHRSKIFYYANLNCDHNVFEPWQLVSLVQKSFTSDAITSMSDVVVISDSEDDDTGTHHDNHGTLCKDFFFLFIGDFKLFV